MKKNVSSQFIGAQMTYSASGTPIVASGAVLTYVRADALPMQLGAVNSGICIPNSYGLHHYIPAQSETNYDWLAFTFVASGGLNVTNQLYTDFPQSGDAFSAAMSAQTGINSLYARVGENAANAPLAGYVNSTAAQVNSNTSAIGSLSTKVGSGFIDVRSIGIQVDSLYAQAVLLSTAAALSSLDTRVSSLVTQVGSGFIDVRSIGVQIGSLFTLGGSLSTRVGSLFTLAGSISTQAGSLQIGVDAIGLKTVNLPPDPADASDIAGAFGVVNAAVSSLDTRVSSVAAQVNSTFTQAGSLSTAVGSLAFGVNVHRINSDANAAGNLRRGALGTTLFTAGGGSTTTLLSLSALSPAAGVADQFKGRIVTFDRDTTTANLRGQATDILSNSALGLLGVTALTDAPVSGDTGTIT